MFVNGKRNSNRNILDNNIITISVDLFWYKNWNRQEILATGLGNWKISNNFLKNLVFFSLKKYKTSVASTLLR